MLAASCGRQAHYSRPRPRAMEWRVAVHSPLNSRGSMGPWRKRPLAAGFFVSYHSESSSDGIASFFSEAFPSFLRASGGVAR